MALETEIEFGKAQQMPTADEDFSLPQNGEVLKIDLACGKQKREGFVGVDSNESLEDIEHRFDLLKFPWPFEESSVFEFNCEHFVEHIPHVVKEKHAQPYDDMTSIIRYVDGETNGLIRFMEEVHRCLISGGLIRIVAPFYTSVRAWQDPTHVRAITDITFKYFDKELAEGALVDHYTGNCNFKTVSQKLHVNNAFKGKSDDALAWCTQHMVNVIDDIEVVLRAVK